jgi:hypothetical protein
MKNQSRENKTEQQIYLAEEKKTSRNSQAGTGPLAAEQKILGRQENRSNTRRETKIDFFIEIQLDL